MKKIITYGALLFAVLLLIEKLVPAIGKLPAAVKHIYVMLLIVLSFVLFNGESLAQVGSDFAGLFGFGNLPAVTGETLYYLRSYAVLFAVGFVGATPIVKNTALRIGKTKVGAVLEVALMMGILLVCTAYLVDGSFSPFLYFRF